MRIQLITYITTLFVALSFSTKAQTINVEAVTKYWELTDSVKQNKPITDEQWTRFINIAGNSTYAHSEFDSARLARYRQAIEIVNMPANDSVLQARLKAGDWYVLLVKRYKDEEKVLKLYLKDTIQNPRYFNKAYQYVYEFLPKKSRHHLHNLMLYYNCLSNDAVSYSSGLYFSLLSVMDNAKTKPGTLEAHELHHRLRTEIDIFSHQQKKDLGILWAIESIPNEGIADMIDKRWEKPEDINDWLIDPAPATIKSLDSCLKVLATGTDTLQSEHFYRNLLKRTTGHMPGFYMAQLIVINGYKRQMIRRSDNPFAFFYLYNKAALKSKAHPPLLSDEAIAYLHRLEKIATAANLPEGEQTKL